MSQLALLRTISAVNAEPHDANIRGAICAERAALCQFQRDEAGCGAKICRVAIDGMGPEKAIEFKANLCILTADGFMQYLKSPSRLRPQPIFPGPCCREFLVATCAPETEVVVSGSAEPEALVTEPLRELLPLPSAYCRRGQDVMKALGESLEAKVGPPAEPRFAAAYAAALACARRQGQQKAIFPVLFAAAARWPSGRTHYQPGTYPYPYAGHLPITMPISGIPLFFDGASLGLSSPFGVSILGIGIRSRLVTHAVAELKGMEYGCTVDAVSLLLPELLRARAESGEFPDCVLQVDQYGVAHAPFASARSLLVEHGLGDVTVMAHTADGVWAEPITARASMPHANYTEMEM
ncbi:unnamed protein product [Prorocentrum cordatum]|uniref:Uncharacterized protein n=1 Tax=Prorocentrum cordatum TaxID=2364126 RepID=A0ABN9UQA9_9DINO|nr:unnamed protein product [Polarella glacialis]